MKSPRSAWLTPRRIAVLVMFFAFELGAVAMLDAEQAALAIGLASAALGLTVVATLARW